MEKEAATAAAAGFCSVKDVLILFYIKAFHSPVLTKKTAIFSL